MERAEWLKKMRAQAEALYDHISPTYWVKWGVRAGETHRQFIGKFLSRLRAQSAILDAGCGAGLYDGMLLEPGHSVLGIDQSSGMLARACNRNITRKLPGTTGCSGTGRSSAGWL